MEYRTSTPDQCVYVSRCFYQKLLNTLKRWIPTSESAVLTADLLATEINIEQAIFVRNASWNKLVARGIFREKNETGPQYSQWQFVERYGGCIEPKKSPWKRKWPKDLPLTSRRMCQTGSSSTQHEWLVWGTSASHCSHSQPVGLASSQVSQWSAVSSQHSALSSLQKCSIGPLI